MKGSATLLAAQGIAILSYFVAQRLILSTLTKEANGILFAERRMVDMFLIIAVDLGLNIIAVRRASQAHDQGGTHSGTVLSSVVAIRLLLTVPVMLFTLGYGMEAGYSLFDIGMWCAFCLLSSRVGVIRYLYEVPYRYSMRFIVPAISAVLDASLFLALLYFNAANLTPTVIIACYLGGVIPGFVMLVVMDRGQYINVRNVSWNEMRSIAMEAIPVASMIMLSTIHDKVDTLMLGWWSPHEQIGIFGAASISIAPIITIVPSVVTLTFMPLLARLVVSNREECEKYVHVLIRGLSLFAVVVSAVLSILTPEVIELMSKGRYAENTLHFAIFLWLPMPIYIVAIAQDAIVTLGLARKSVLIGTSLALSTVIVGALLIPMYAALGATITKIASVCIGATTSLLLLKPMIAGGLNRRFVASLLTPIAVGVTGFIVLPMIMQRWLAAPLNGTLVILTALLVGLFSVADVRHIRTVLKSRIAGRS